MVLDRVQLFCSLQMELVVTTTNEQISDLLVVTSQKLYFLRMASNQRFQFYNFKMTVKKIYVFSEYSIVRQSLQFQMVLFLSEDIFRITTTKKILLLIFFSIK